MGWRKLRITVHGRPIFVRLGPAVPGSTPLVHVRRWPGPCWRSSTSPVNAVRLFGELVGFPSLERRLRAPVPPLAVLAQVIADWLDNLEKVKADI
ncbi:hypothetical protein AB0F81_14025 [Actinoplanes sp. NPDC024001]|uniref:hypothetical protein n=1 Tax=Actinoplanes sp. NPDC024001 TaxID=3154598 RepID=UPI00340166E6